MSLPERIVTNSPIAGCPPLGLRPVVLDGVYMEPLATQEAFRLATISDEVATYGCGTAPDFDRLPLAARA